jgi:hypothetical protein
MIPEQIFARQIIWINASFVIHAEITRLQSLKANWAIQFADRDEEEFVLALKIVLDVLRDMVDRCPVHSACQIVPLTWR